MPDEPYPTVQIAGGIFPTTFLSRLVSGDDVEHRRAEDYGAYGEKIQDTIAASWNRLRLIWTRWQAVHKDIDEAEHATTPTQEKWLLPLLEELRISPPRRTLPYTIEDKVYPISHSWEHVPIHLVGWNVELDKKHPHAPGASTMSPFGLVQEYLNRTDASLWGLVSNGRTLRLLRDNQRLTRQAYVEFDLEAMMEGENYSDYVVLYLLCHLTRFKADKPDACILEQWFQTVSREDTRALDQLRDGVKRSIEALGAGFLAHRENKELRDKLESGALTAQDYYREVLRLVYRLLFLFVAEDRDLLHPKNTKKETRRRYAEYYGTKRLRNLADKFRGTHHDDQYRTLRMVIDGLSTDAGNPALGLPALGSFLWSPKATPWLDRAQITNAYFLEAVRALAFTEKDERRRSVDYRHLGPEELGGVYESLLEQVPVIHLESASFEIRPVGGNERKTSGSYYTPPELVQTLLDSALDPVLDRAGKAASPKKAILSLRVCDPACGSGHFLIAAAHRIAKRLAQVESGDSEPSRDATQSAIREVVSHCIFGVDINPMAVELCKVSLWMEALEPGKPLSFLDSRIQCGNSLIGTTPTLMAAGIPDEAFTVLTGDDAKTVASLKKQNKTERDGKSNLGKFVDVETGDLLVHYGAQASKVEDLPTDTIQGLRQQEQAYYALSQSPEYERAKLEADTWCAAFVSRKTPSTVRAGPQPITQRLWRAMTRDAARHPDEVATVVSLAGTRGYRFFHWHLAFPTVFQPTTGLSTLAASADGERPRSLDPGWTGGFDVVIGNPPWERVKLQEEEWFEGRDPAIVAARNQAARRRMIEDLKTSAPKLYAEFHEAKRMAEGESQLLRNTGRYPLCGRGDVNTYAVFAEGMRQLLSQTGRMGVITPQGIATDFTTRFFFQDIMASKTLASLWGFENEARIFATVNNEFKFCLLTIAGGAQQESAKFVFFARRATDLQDAGRRFTLDVADIERLNPNSQTCPVFRSTRDAELAKVLYANSKPLIRDGPPEINPWGISFLRMFDMASDSMHFRTAGDLKEAGYTLEGNTFRRDASRHLPLYEGKMFWHFDHRFGTYEGQTEAQNNKGVLPQVTDEQKADRHYSVLPNYWVDEKLVREKQRTAGLSPFYIAFRDVTNAVVLRTGIFSALPPVAVGHKAPLFVFDRAPPEDQLLFLAMMNSHIMDYSIRQSIGGTSLSYFIVKQLPVLTPERFEELCPWSANQPVGDWLKTRVAELVFTTHDLGWLPPWMREPAVWDPDRRSKLYAEIDAAFLHLYGVSRPDAEHVLDSFGVERRYDERDHGSHRTKDMILAAYDELAAAAAVARNP